MGVPKLFRYLVDRYPSLCQNLSANQMIQYDYLYIDLNFLIHKATTEKGLLPLEDQDDEFTSEPWIFERILRYIETLHRIVPTKVLFLAIDGVAPHAKWSIQRERRMRAIEKGIGAKTSFDSNCISPGTTFMSNFEAVLLEFVSNKIKSQKNWQNCEVLINGSNSPGEGSLKIIEFIRTLKQTPGNTPNKLHCIYSGDNDYLMLGLATREPHVSFIQERKATRPSWASLCFDDVKHQFCVMHFEMLRQYLQMEFVGCKSEMKFDFNMDSIADDWVLLMTFIGNDYIPGLPNFDSRTDILTIIYDAYKEVLKTSNGYINEHGILNIRRFARLLQILKPKDFDLYSESQKHSVAKVDEALSAINLDANGNSLNGDYKNSDKAQDIFSDFLEMKDQYYTEFLGNEQLPDFAAMSTKYVETIQWILHYYYRGTSSWTYHYPYKFVPFVSDLTIVNHTSFSTEITDEPANPFTHLLDILPKDSCHLLPESYQPFAVDGEIGFDDLLRKCEMANAGLGAKDKSRNQLKPMLKLKLIPTTKSVKIVEVPTKGGDLGHSNHVIKRNHDTKKFSTLNMHQYSSQIVKDDLTKPSHMVLSLKSDQSKEIDDIAKEFLNQEVYINWPHFSEAKVVQIFNATKKFEVSNDIIKVTDGSTDFESCVDVLQNRYKEAGINVGEIKLVAFVAPLKCLEYKPVKTQDMNLYVLDKNWDDDLWKPVAAQTLIKSPMDEIMQWSKLFEDELHVPNVFLFGGQSNYYGEIAQIVDAQSLSVNGRVNILSYVDPEPNFDMAKQTHVTSKKDELNEFKSRAAAATLLGISERVLARITGSVLIGTGKSTDYTRKINIGLQMKSNSVYQSGVQVLHDYVQSIGNHFLYSQLAIDLVQKYMDKFPRVFELLSVKNDFLQISDFEPNNNDSQALEYLSEVRKWLQQLPYFKKQRKPTDLMRLSDVAREHVQKAVNDSYASDAKILKLKMKWQNLYIPDLNNVFVNPSPDSVFKLLDRIVIVRSGYPFPIGSKGTVIGIEPIRGHIAGTDVTANQLHALEILMDTPYKIDSEFYKFKRHQVFCTSSTNMLINMSHGRAN